MIEAFRERAEVKGIGYQTAINEALRAAIRGEGAPVTVRTLRKVIREELRDAG